MSISITAMQAPISDIVNYRHLNSSRSIGAGSEFSTLVAPGNSASLNPDRDVENKIAGMLFSNMMKFIIPAKSDEITGNGLSFEYWNSFLADAIAEAVNKSGKIDLKIDRD